MHPSERPTLLYPLRDQAEAAFPPVTPGQAEANGASPGIFRVKPGFNPNSSSLGTSVVTLVWGVGVAGAIFQLVGLWLRTDLQADGVLAGAAEPSEAGQPGGEPSAVASAPPGLTP